MESSATTSVNYDTHPVFSQLRLCLKTPLPTPWDSRFSKCLGTTRAGTACDLPPAVRDKAREIGREAYGKLSKYTKFQSTSEFDKEVKQLFKGLHCKSHVDDALKNYENKKTGMAIGAGKESHYDDNASSCSNEILISRDTGSDIFDSESEPSTAATTPAASPPEERDLFLAADDDKRPETPTPMIEAQHRLDEEDFVPGLGKLQRYKTQKFKHRLMKSIGQDLTAQEQKAGVVYVFRKKGDTRRFKIGWTQRSARERLADPQHCAAQDSELVYPLFEADEAPFVGAKRVERLVQDDLRQLRRKVLDCPKCDGEHTHTEWFEAEEEVVLNCVRSWTSFVRYPAYVNGQLAGKAAGMHRMLCRPDELPLLLLLDSKEQSALDFTSIKPEYDRSIELAPSQEASEGQQSENAKLQPKASDQAEPDEDHECAHVSGAEGNPVKEGPITRSRFKQGTRELGKQLVSRVLRKQRRGDSPQEANLKDGEAPVLTDDADEGHRDDSFNNQGETLPGPMVDVLERIYAPELAMAREEAHKTAGSSAIENRRNFKEKMQLTHQLFLDIWWSKKRRTSSGRKAAESLI